jgi:class 3 adenylate cyclase
VALVLSGKTLAPYIPRLVTGWAGQGARHRALDCTLVSVDVSGFTALSERLAAHGKLGAEELIRRISDCYAELISTTVSYGGDVLKFRGDALLIVFWGADHELRATAAALDMQAVIAERGETDTMAGPIRLGIACGVHSGECDFFLVGSSHGELIVAGPAASAVLALEDAAESGEILVSAQTAAHLEPELLGGSREGARLLVDDAVAPVVSVPPLEPTIDKPLDDLVPGPLRPLLAAGATDPEHRQATVAFVKFSGTDALGGAAAEAIAALGAHVGSTADELGITWLESDIDYNGGKMYLVAGAPSSGGEDEERMLRALRRIVDEDHGLPVCAGVNRGRVFVGDIGSDLRRTYAVMGDTVNVAARLAGKAQKGQILASEAVLAQSKARWETVGTPMLMKGKARALTAHAIGAVVEERRTSDELLPIVGREEELARIQEALDSARRRSSALVELVGEPGIGKSRLVEELKVRALGFQQLSTRCEPYSGSTPYAPFKAVLRSLVGIVPEDDPEAAGAQLRDWVEAVMPDLAPWLPLLATPFHAEVPSTPEVDETDAQFRHERLHETVDTFLSRVLLMRT